jgi:hypothetical protein
MGGGFMVQIRVSRRLFERIKTHTEDVDRFVAEAVEQALE